MKTEHNGALSNTTSADGRLGQIAYHAYANAVGFKSVSGDDLPAYEQLDTKVQLGWQEAARAIATECINGRYH